MAETESLAEALTAAIRALPHKLRDVEVPRVKQSLEQIADQLSAMAVRLRTLKRQLGGASLRLTDPALQNSAQLITEAFRLAAQVAEQLRPEATGWVRFVPKPVARPYLDGWMTIEIGFAAARDLTRICVAALPEIGNGMKDVSEDLGGAAELLDGTARAIRELANMVPSLGWRTEPNTP